MGGFFFSLLHKASAAFHRRIAGSAGETGLLDGVAADSPFAMASKEFEKQVKRVDEAMHLMQTISLEVGDASDLRSALKITAGKICNFTGWSFGEVWVPNFDGSALEYYSAWHGRKEVLGAFAETSMGMIFPPGVGLPGRVWRTKEPEWIKDVSAALGAFPRAGDALAAGFKAGFGVPIVAGGEVAAVMVFFMTEAGDDDARLIELVSTAAIHLGTVIRRRISEYAREEIKRRYEELINNIAAGIYRSVPGEGRFIEANRAFVDMMGAQSKEELLKQDPAVFYQDKKKMKEINEKLSSGGFIKNLEVELVTLQGRRIWVSTSAVMKRDREGRIYCDGIVEDITGRKRLEEQLIHSQRMEAVGQLAAGIAHDFNNILTAIIGYANLLAMKTL
ncbi:MAG: PAS domain S-box protein, partial [Deltaproteobacteria bacterium]|nr:PAS domain S-box protein [Deltaproteobacteria bacterium]